jgi:hypothetical protein
MILFCLLLSSLASCQLKRLCLLAIFKNEAMVMQEWLEHNRQFGVELFFLGDNNSTDNYLDGFKGKEIDDIVFTRVTQSFHQKAYYNSMQGALTTRCEFVLVDDLDEYVYTTVAGGFKTIGEYLGTLSKDVSQVCINWLMFGACGYIKQPKHIRKSFVLREQKMHVNRKCIARPSKVTDYGIHVHQVNGKTITDNTNLHLNHYPIMSVEYFTKTKLTRGNADNPSSYNIRDMAYFARYNSSASFYDLELSRLAAD